ERAGTAPLQTQRIETMAYTDITIQQAIITETLAALGYQAQADKFVQAINDEVAYCFQNVPGEGWQVELMAICPWTAEQLSTWEDDVYKKILEVAVELDRSNVRDQAYDEGAEDMKWEAQREFESAFWDHMDGAESDFEPAIYGQRED